MAKPPKVERGRNGRFGGGEKVERSEEGDPNSFTSMDCGKRFCAESIGKLEHES